jgi:sugar phosphate permease
MRQDIPRKLPHFSLHWAWIILSVCFINLFINYGIRLGYSVVLPEMIRAMNIGRRQAGDIFNAYLFAYFSISPFTGYLTDKFGARRIIPLFGILLGCGTILMGTSNALLGASLTFAMVGAGASAMWTPVLTVVQRWFSEKKRGLALGILSSGTGLGFAVMGSLHPLIIKTWSWRYSWYIPGGAALAMAVVNVLLLHSSPEDVNFQPWGAKNNYNTKDNNVQLPLKRNGRYAEILKARNFWIIGFSYFLASISLYTVTTFMVDYAHNSLHFTFERASLLALIHGFAQIAGVLSMPILSDYIGRKMTLIISNFIIGVSTLSIVLAGSTELLLFISVGVLGAWYGITWPMYGACAGDYFRKENIGSVIGAWTPFYGIGAVVAHRIAGHIRDITGSFTGPFLIAIVTALSASALFLFIKSAKKPIR